MGFDELEKILDNLPDCPFCGCDRLNGITGDGAIRVSCSLCTASADLEDWKKRSIK